MRLRIVQSELNILRRETPRAESPEMIDTAIEMFQVGQCILGEGRQVDRDVPESDTF